MFGNVFILLISVLFHWLQIHLMSFAALQERLNAEKQKRQQAEASSQEKERQNSMLSVDYRQLQQQLHKLEGEYRQECEKVVSFYFYISM